MTERQSEAHMDAHAAGIPIDQDNEPAEFCQMCCSYHPYVKSCPWPDDE